MNRGFSLVELSIVLVILGLLTGGILAGQSLIRSSQLRAISADFNRFQSAVSAFREKYNAIPGDMNNAVAYWGAADGTTGMTAGCLTANNNNATTCNGDGSQQLGPIAWSHENFRFWQHLTNAGLLEGKYSGVAGSGGPDHGVVGVNVPAGKISNSGYWVEYVGDVSGNPALFDGSYGHVIRFAAETPTSIPNAATITPQEMWGIDTKIDDGKPGTGTVFAHKGSAQSCADSDGATTAVYLTTLTTPNCVLFLRTNF